MPMRILVTGSGGQLGQALPLALARHAVVGLRHADLDIAEGDAVRSALAAAAPDLVINAAGWTDEAIYFAITVCALFNFYNRWIDASGVHALSDEAHREGGKRMALHGYVRE